MFLKLDKRDMYAIVQWINQMDHYLDRFLKNPVKNLGYCKYITHS